MAGVSMTPPIFEGHIDQDINVFIRRFKGFLDGIGIVPPVGACAIGLFQSCLQGPAADWYDRNILGKNWKLNNIFNNHGQADIAGLQGQTMQEMRTTNSFRPNSLASTFANIGGNNVVTVGDPIAKMIPAEAFEEDWTNAGGEPTDDPVNIPAVHGNNNPIVLQGIGIGQALFHFKNNYPTVLEERRKVKFANLEQDNEPVREYYNKLKKYGSLLNYGNEMVEHQFFMGLSPDNQLEIDRIGAEKPIEELVKILERVEKRKSEMKLGITKRARNATRYDTTHYETTPESASQRPISGYSQEDVDRIIKNVTEKITENFQAQNRDLQANIPIQKSVTSSIQKLHKSPNQEEHITTTEDLSPEELFWSYLLAAFGDSKNPQSHGDSKNPQSHTDKLASRIAERIEEKKLDKEIDNTFPQLFGNLNVNDDSDAMDTSNVVREIANDDEYTLQLVRKKK